ncbi:hypothetical protein AU188_11445 [Mycobacterium sp. IS-3022]|nr:hypothetical protein AU188_11445 [Mycobacterium sp. IS-3022]
MNAETLRHMAACTEHVHRMNGQPMSPDVAATVEEILSGSSRPGTDYVTATQVAAKLGITKRAVNKRAPSLGGVKVGGRWLFHREHVARAVAATGPR